MTVPRSAVRLTTLCCLSALALGSCGTDERTLVYGVGVGSAGHEARAGSSSRPAHAGEGGDAQGGMPDDILGGAPFGGTPGHGGTLPAVAGSAGATPNGGGGGSGGTGGSATGGGGTNAASGAGGSGGNGTGGNQGGTGGGGNGGSGGNGGTPEVNPDTGPCGDLDHNGTQDCNETLVTNASFQQAATGWVAEANLTQTWSAEDARGQASSGSLSLVSNQAGSGDGWGIAGTGQCLVATAGEVYAVGARALVPANQAQGRAAVGMVIFGNDGCQGTVLKAAMPAALGTAGGWQVIKGELKMPPATRSIYIRLAAEKPLAQSSFEVHFDDILIRKK